MPMVFQHWVQKAIRLLFSGKAFGEAAVARCTPSGMVIPVMRVVVVGIVMRLRGCMEMQLLAKPFARSSDAFR